MSDSLILVDGMAMVYRAFYAIQGLSTKDGKPTNAIYGFIRLLNQLQDTWKPTHRAVVFDAGLPAARMALLPTYKAQRPEMPADLRAQLAGINEYLACACVSSVSVAGEEADDVMGAMARHIAGSGMSVLIATSDKDMMQVVDDRISIIPLTKAGECLGPSQVVARTGVPPSAIVEWLSLIGDAADNIPGVPGVGDKTATKLLQQFGRLEVLWQSLDQVKTEKLRENLRNNRAIVERNVQMMTLREAMPEAFALADLQVRKPEPEALLAFFRKMEFQKMAAEMEDQMMRLF